MTRTRSVGRNRISKATDTPGLIFDGSGNPIKKFFDFGNSYLTSTTSVLTFFTIIFFA